ncbi:helix-turn-helix domain-containing protein [Caulobacter vibrioides]|nr:helix-turn-helix transcriptional regulator [Caulobacter vibrioides]YP_002515424.1 HTH transcriptional regulator [Caulobacter vibrioides NA1000]ACL93516.1 HTH transcriptional regulator [Caulobacter vibrioides NA1000]QXZ52146.1 helix-turn-helix domain-containing protein [Caulobacter vibrioides]
MGMRESSDTERHPNPVDLHVGARIRMRRRILGVSQERLAEDLGLTFQQVQKYERGANRVSASKLYEIARSLQSPVDYFFEGLEDTTGGGMAERGEPFVHDFLMTPEGLELATLFPKVSRQKVRRRILELVRSMAAEDAASGLDD